MNVVGTTYEKGLRKVPQNVRLMSSIASSIIQLLFQFIITVLLVVCIIMSPMVILYKLGLQDIAKFYPVAFTVAISAITIIAVIKTSSIE